MSTVTVGFPGDAPVPEEPGVTCRADPRRASLLRTLMPVLGTVNAKNRVMILRYLLKGTLFDHNFWNLYVGRSKTPTGRYEPDKAALEATKDDLKRKLFEGSPPDPMRLRLPVLASVFTELLGLIDSMSDDAYGKVIQNAKRYADLSVEASDIAYRVLALDFLEAFGAEARSCFADPVNRLLYPTDGAGNIRHRSLTMDALEYCRRERFHDLRPDVIFLALAISLALVEGTEPELNRGEREMLRVLKAAFSDCFRERSRARNALSAISSISTSSCSGEPESRPFFDLFAEVIEPLVDMNRGLFPLLQRSRQESLLMVAIALDLVGSPDHAAVAFYRAEHGAPRYDEVIKPHFKP